MTTESTIYVVRHGQTPWTASERIQGWAPVPLNETGRNQMESTAAHLDAQIEQRTVQLVTSDLRRARESTAIVAETLDSVSEPTLDSAWRERNFGVYQGLDDERYEHDDVIQSSLEESFLWQPENGESWRDVETRVLIAWEQLLESLDPGSSVVIVAHTGPIYCLLAAVNNRRLETVFETETIAEASVTRIEYKDGKTQLVATNSPPSN